MSVNKISQMFEWGDFRSYHDLALETSSISNNSFGNLKKTSRKTFSVLNYSNIWLSDQHCAVNVFHIGQKESLK